jgi:hypothetical protein
VISPDAADVYMAGERARQVPHEWPLQQHHRARHELDDRRQMQRNAEPHDITDSVAVTDCVRGKRFMLPAGGSYPAKAPKQK